MKKIEGSSPESSVMRKGKRGKDEGGGVEEDLMDEAGEKPKWVNGVFLLL